MHSPDIEKGSVGLQLAEVDAVFGLIRLCAWARVQAHALAVPALANFLMQGLVC